MANAMISPLYFPLILLAAVAGVGLSLFAWVHRETPGAGPIALLLFAASLWSLTQSLSVFSSSPIFWARLTVSISTVLPLAWLLVVFEYTGRERWLAGPRLLGLLVEPIVFTSLVWTNDSHHAVWTAVRSVPVDGYTVFVGTKGLGYWAHLVYAYALVAIGAVILLRVLLRTDGVFRDQSTALLAAIVVPMAIHALYVFDVVANGIDPTGIAFVVTGTVLTGSMLRQHLLDVTPATRDLGREEVIEQLEDPVVIVDGSDTLVDLNPAGESVLGVEADAAIGRDIASIAPTLGDAIDTETAEITLDRGGVRRHYDVRVSELDRAYGTVTGRIVSLRDVTERTQREQRLDVMNRLFRHNLRNEMNVVRGNAELLGSRTDDSEQHDRADRIIATVDEIIGRSDKIGTLSRALDDDPERSLDLGSILRPVVSSVRSNYPGATVTLDTPDACRVVGDPSIEVAVVELLENAIEHADRPDPTVFVTLEIMVDRQVELRIEDDGPGIPAQELQVLAAGTETPLQHGSGIGLWLVTWIVERAGGTIEFEVSESGTTAIVRLPRADSS
ncbi:MAG: histidine kinase N-terminal 7TM domain-containing protein [Halapricum sp.]